MKNVGDCHWGRLPMCLLNVVEEAVEGLGRRAESFCDAHCSSPWTTSMMRVMIASYWSWEGTLAPGVPFLSWCVTVTTTRRSARFCACVELGPEAGLAFCLSFHVLSLTIFFLVTLFLP